MIHVISVINVTNNCINISLVYLLLFFCVSKTLVSRVFILFFQKLKCLFYI